MAKRIAGVSLPDNKRILFALPYISGIGLSSAKNILKKVGVDPTKKVKDITSEELSKLIKEIETNYKVEGALKAEIRANIKRLQEINCYRGIRHKLGLPVRGQRTRTNARVRKGPKKTSGTIKRKGK